MERKTRRNILAWIIFLSIIGLITSLYLTKNHCAPPSGGGALCDFGEFLSCSLVNSSSFAEFLNVPVAVFGALWYVIMLLMVRKAWKEDGKEKNFLPTAILGWSFLGLLSVVYFIVAEFILRAICIFCTIVHVVIIITFILASILQRGHHIKITMRSLLKAAKPWIATIIVLNLIPVVIFSMLVPEKQDTEELTKCLTEKGVNLYSSFRCGHCRQQEELFGESFQYINMIECHPDAEETQYQLCLEKKISGTPTWIMEPEGNELKRNSGYMTVDELKEWSGCG